MKNKYINIDDIDKEISKSYDLITTLEHEIVREKKRIEYLQALLFYLEHNGICPFTRRELLENDLKLQDYVLPILACINMSERFTYYCGNDKWEKLKVKIKNCKESSTGQVKALFAYVLDKMKELEGE